MLFLCREYISFRKYECIVQVYEKRNFGTSLCMSRYFKIAAAHCFGQIFRFFNKYYLLSKALFNLTILVTILNLLNFNC